MILNCFHFCIFLFALGVGLIGNVTAWPTSSSCSKERSPSPSPSSAYLGGGQSSQSRRSSIQSVGALSEPQEVNPVHVNFVKDTSRFWYKPNIAREDGNGRITQQLKSPSVRLILCCRPAGRLSKWRIDVVISLAYFPTLGR